MRYRLAGGVELYHIPEMSMSEAEIYYATRHIIPDFIGAEVPCLGFASIPNNGGVAFNLLKRENINGEPALCVYMNSTLVGYYHYNNNDVVRAGLKIVALKWQ